MPYNKRGSNRKKNHKKNFHPESKKSLQTRNLERQSGHGFQEFKDAETMTKYLGTDPEKAFAFDLQPTMGRRRPTKKDLERSGAHK